MRIFQFFTYITIIFGLFWDTKILLKIFYFKIFSRNIIFWQFGLWEHSGVDRDGSCLWQICAAEDQLSVSQTNYFECKWLWARVCGLSFNPEKRVENEKHTGRLFVNTQGVLGRDQYDTIRMIIRLRDKEIFGKIGSFSL